jgi:hypothetical protein
LMPASGHQDHTTSPSAKRRSSAQRIAPGDLRPSHPTPTFVTMANVPLSGSDAANMKVICVRCERKYFFEWDWTANSLICPSG